MSEANKVVLKGEHSLEAVAAKVEHLVTEVIGAAEAKAEHLLAEVFTRRFNILAQNTHPALNLEASVVSVDPRAVKVLHKGEVVGHWQPEGTDLVRPSSAPAPVVEPEEEEGQNQGSGEPVPVTIQPVVEPEVKDPAEQQEQGEGGEQGDDTTGGERDESDSADREEQQQ